MKRKNHIHFLSLTHKVKILSNSLLIFRIIKSSSINNFQNIRSSSPFSNTNQSAAIHINDHQISIELDPTFKIHPHYPFSMKRIIEL